MRARPSRPRACHPAAGGRAITVSRAPYRGTTPVARETVIPGIPGMPGTPDPDPASSPVPGRVGKPLPDNAVTGLLDGADQLAGTDIDPSVPARARAAVTLPRPAPPPRLDAAPLSCGAAMGAGAKFGRGIPKA